MPAMPLTKPEHLRPIDGRGGRGGPGGRGGSRRAWLARRPAALIAMVLGLASFVIVAVAQPALWAVPDWRLSVPGLAATAIAALISLARREPAGYSLWLVGLGLACAALVLGWFLMLAIVIGATVVLILILHVVM